MVGATINLCNVKRNDEIRTTLALQGITRGPVTSGLSREWLGDAGALEFLFHVAIAFLPLQLAVDVKK